MKIELKIGQTIETPCGVAVIDSFSNENHSLDVPYPDGTVFVYVVGNRGRWANWYPYSDVVSFRRKAIQAQYQKALFGNTDEVLKLIQSQYLINWNIAIAATELLNRRNRRRDHCPDCGQHWIFHEFIGANATEPSDYVCPKEELDYTGEKSRQEQVHDRFEELGWNCDIPF